MLFLFLVCLGLSFKKWTGLQDFGIYRTLWAKNGQDCRMGFLGLNWGLFGQDSRITRFTG